MKIFENDTDMSFSNGSIGASAPDAAFGKTASADFASARYMFESPADAGLSNRSIGAVAPAAAFGKTLMQVFQTAASVLSHRLPHSAKPHPRFCLSEV